MGSVLKGMVMGSGKNVIACRIFQNEIEAINFNRSDISFHWIDAALHADPDKMEQEISSVLKNIDPCGEIRFLFGNGCHPDMCNILKKAKAAIPPEKNCLHAFLGEDKAKELEKDRTMIITPGWIEAWQGIMDGLGWDATDTRINLRRYDRILLLDPGINEISAETTLEFYDLVQVPIEFMKLNLSIFENFVKKVLK
jgi:hypothetical protein